MYQIEFTRVDDDDDGEVRALIIERSTALEEVLRISVEDR